MILGMTTTSTTLWWELLWTKNRRLYKEPRRPCELKTPQFLLPWAISKGPNRSQLWSRRCVSQIPSTPSVTGHSYWTIDLSYVYQEFAGTQNVSPLSNAHTANPLVSLGKGRDFKLSWLSRRPSSNRWRVEPEAENSCKNSQPALGFIQVSYQAIMFINHDFTGCLMATVPVLRTQYHSIMLTSLPANRSNPSHARDDHLNNLIQTPGQHWLVLALGRYTNAMQPNILSASSFRSRSESSWFSYPHWHNVGYLFHSCTICFLLSCRLIMYMHCSHNGIWYEINLVKNAWKWDPVKFSDAR